MNTIKNYIETHKNRFIDELFDFLRIPSVSADSAYVQDVLDAAEHVKNILDKIGCDNTQLLETKGHPIVYGEKIINKNFPTVMVYGHYDVQPPDPIGEWNSNPFEPVVKKTITHPNGAIFARGASDDKGQLFMHFKAFEYLIQTNQLECNVKFMIEGEEEIGSPNLDNFIEEHNTLLENDVIIISDTTMIAANTPSITTGLRGMASVEVSVYGPNRDLHSGMFGGAVVNPLQVLAEMITKLKDEENKITIPEFYETISEVSNEEKALLNKVPFDEEQFKLELGINEITGESGFQPLEQLSMRPTLDLNGIWGGYTGEGSKTIIPSEAHAKITMRLVPGQDPKKIAQNFENYFKALAPASVNVNVKNNHGSEAYVTPIDSIAYKAAEAAYEETFDQRPFPLRSGGTIGIVPLFEKELKSKSILMGFGLSTDAIHSPNEHFGLDNFFKGIETIPHFYKHFAAMNKSR